MNWQKESDEQREQQQNCLLCHFEGDWYTYKETIGMKSTHLFIFFHIHTQWPHPNLRALKA
jgi:hypothetical protein